MDSLEDLGISPALCKRLNKLGLQNPFDLLLHLPLRYEDETRITPINELTHGLSACVEGTVLENRVQYRPRRQLHVLVRDESGALILRFIHFYGSQVDQLAKGAQVRLSGEVRRGPAGLEMIHPRYRLVRSPMSLPTALTPVYPTTAGLSQTHLRRCIQLALEHTDMHDVLPDTVRQELQLPGLPESLKLLHQPPAHLAPDLQDSGSHPAWKRIRFDELLAQQLSMRMHHRKRQTLRAPIMPSGNGLRATFMRQLPFQLTGAQLRVLDQIDHDLRRPSPMHRLLQGDVGSGKTVVAALACLSAIDSGFQAALMAPTEILAEQHFRTLTQWLEPLGLEAVWLTGHQKKKDREHVLKRIASGEARLVVGTHALIQGPVAFNALGLVIIDEQHRFGVEQRLALRRKGEHSPQGHPHQLMMSATPIPRTLSMSYFADLDVSTLDEVPPGRHPVTTKLVDQSRRDELMDRLRDICHEGGQAYWICPLIEESEALQLQTATETHAWLSSALPDLRVALLHGRLPAQEKARCMNEFARGDIHLLVATTVVEVGVDVPNAHFMVIEHAERMGLSQLHQLRGRVGRGSRQGICVMLYHAPLSPVARQRLKVIYEHQDGFEIARQDLMIRGPGEYLGARQSGAPLLRFARLEEDAALLDRARYWSERWLDEDPEGAALHMERWLLSRQEFLAA